MKRVALAVVIVLAVLVLASCAPGPNSAAGTGGEVAGFWKGLWHGAIALITFVISLFNDNVNIYEVNNNGGWYNFGFVLGIMIFWGGGSGGAASRRR
jgi:predicted small secreted protein